MPCLSVFHVQLLCCSSTDWPGCCLLARNVLPWSVASIKMLLLSRGPGKETNSQGSNYHFKTIALFKKVIYPQAAASSCTRYIIDKYWHSSMHSSHTQTPCITWLGLAERTIAVFLSSQAKERCQETRCLNRHWTGTYTSTCMG